MAARRRLGLAGLLLLALAALPSRGGAFANVEVGERVEDAELPGLDGKPHRILGEGAAASVLVFFRARHERSADALRQMAECERVLAGRKVHWVAIVSDAWSAEEIRATVGEAGIRMPVLLDRGDALYGRLGVRLHPTVGVIDAGRRLAGYEPFRQINYCDRVLARIRYALGEIGEAELARVEDPGRSVTRTGSGVARRHEQLARSLFRLEQHEKALAEVRKSLAHGASAAAYALEGRILAAQGRCPEALRALAAAAELDPANADAAEGRKACGR